MTTKMKIRLHALLKRLERFLKTDTMYLVKGGSWLSVGRGVSVAVGLTLSVVYANFLPVQAFGVYKYIQSLTNLFSVFSLTGMTTAMTQAVARGNEGALRSGVYTYLKWSVGMVLLAGGAAAYYLYQGNETLGIPLLVFGATVPWFRAARFSQAYLNGKKRFKQLTINSLFRAVVPALAIIYTVVHTNDPQIVLIVYFVANTLVALVVFAHVLYQYRPPVEKDPRMERFAWHLTAMNLLGNVAGQADKLFIFHFLGPAQLAIYAFALAPVTEIKSLNTILKKLLIPKLTVRSLPELQGAMGRKVLIYVSVLLAITLLYIAAAPLLYQFVFPQYLSSLPLSQVFALSILFLPSLFFAQALTAHEKHRPLYLNRTVIPLAKIGLLAVLLPLYGVWGAIITLLAIQAANLGLYAYQFYRA